MVKSSQGGVINRKLVGSQKNRQACSRSADNVCSRLMQWVFMKVAINPWADRGRNDRHVVGPTPSKPADHRIIHRDFMRAARYPLAGKLGHTLEHPLE